MVTNFDYALIDSCGFRPKIHGFRVFLWTNCDICNTFDLDEIARTIFPTKYLSERLLLTVQFANAKFPNSSN